MTTPHDTHLGSNAETYAQDFSAWCFATAALVREEHWDTIDRDALIEELESLGKSLKRELESRLEGLVMHLLKWASQPGRRLESHSWYDTILEHRNQIARLLRDSPSLKPQVPLLLEEVYPAARAWALGEMTSYTHEKQVRQFLQQDPQTPQRGQGLDLETFHILIPPPPECPWTATQVLDPDFWPDTP